MSETQPVIIGAGLAGLAAALALAPMPCILMTAGKLGEGGSSGWAQGGIAAALGTDDSPALHAEDTLRAGAGLCDAAIVASVTQEAPDIIAWLTALGVVFDRDERGQYRLGLEAAHSRRRIIHAQGDGTGGAIIAALVKKLRTTPSITVIEQAQVQRLLTDDHGISGLIFEHDGRSQTLAARQIVLATGGCGALWSATTNHPDAWGRGLVLALRAGATLRDLEFMQFHPTAIDTGATENFLPLPLASEALRGEGGTLVDETGLRIMQDYPRTELEPRDVVARAIWRSIAAGHRVLLDTRAAIGDTFPQRFPTIYALCQKSGIDPVTQPIPVRPAAHYHMGGVATDDEGRTNVPGLWACGEVAATGLHGANRLASNSLLEATIFGRRVAHAIKQAPVSVPIKPPTEIYAKSPPPDAQTWQKIRQIMMQSVGLLRGRAGLEFAAAELLELAPICDAALIGYAIAQSALKRQESRGAQARSDFPKTDPALAHSTTFTHNDLPLSLRSQRNRHDA